MSADYEPGTLAVATVRGIPNVRVMAGYGTAEPKLRWLTTDARLVDEENDGWYFSFSVTDVRPLVVLDLSRVGNTLDDANGIAQALIFTGIPVAVDIAHMILEQSRPPKPPEPQGLGAVVEDSEGVLWTRCSRIAGHPWQDADDNHFGTAYGAIDVVRVLSEGVQP